MPGFGGAPPNPDDDNDSLVSVTDSGGEHERKVEEAQKARDKLKTEHVVDMMVSIFKLKQ